MEIGSPPKSWHLGPIVLPDGSRSCLLLFIFFNWAVTGAFSSTCWPEIFFHILFISTTFQACPWIFKAMIITYLHHPWAILSKRSEKEDQELQSHVDVMAASPFMILPDRAPAGKEEMYECELFSVEYSRCVLCSNSANEKLKNPSPWHPGKYSLDNNIPGPSLFCLLTYI